MIYLHKRPLVSVILASYNHESFISEAIESVLNQGVDAMELIVVDDGSTDATASIVERYRNRRVRLVRLNENRRYQTRNLGLKLAGGKYIAFQNSDDVWKAGKLLQQLNFLEENGKYSACFTGVDIIDENGRNTPGSFAEYAFTREDKPGFRWLRHFFDHGNCLCISSSLVRKKALDKVGYFHPALFQISDLDLWIRLAAVGEFCIIPESLTCMRIVGEKNVSRPTPSSLRRNGLEWVEVLERYIEQPVLGRLKEVFPDIIPGNCFTETDIIVSLMRYCWTLSPHHIMFANQVFSGLLKDPAKRERMVAVFGNEIIHEFIYNRGRLEITTSE